MGDEHGRELQHHGHVQAHGCHDRGDALGTRACGATSRVTAHPLPRTDLTRHPPSPPQVTCLLHLVTSLEDVENNWVTFEMEMGSSTNPDGSVRVIVSLRDEGAFGLYVAAFYAAVMALPMGVPNFVVPVTIWERVSSIFAMLFLGSIYAYVIGECAAGCCLRPAVCGTRAHLMRLAPLQVPSATWWRTWTPRRTSSRTTWTR